MDMQEFYDRHNLNKYEFASIAGVGKNTLVKYANGQPIREEAKVRIEKAMAVAEKYNLVRPEFDYAKGFSCSLLDKHEHHEKVRKFAEHFKHLIEMEG